MIQPRSAGTVCAPFSVVSFWWALPAAVLVLVQVGCDPDTVNDGGAGGSGGFGGACGQGGFGGEGGAGGARRCLGSSGDTGTTGTTMTGGAGGGGSGDCGQLRGSCTSLPDGQGNPACEEFAGFADAQAANFSSQCQDAGNVWSDSGCLDNGTYNSGCRVAPLAGACVTSWVQYDNSQQQSAGEAACAQAGGTVLAP